MDHVYKKIIYKEFTDIHFNQTKPQPNNHGFIGPILTAEVGDQLVVYFKNNATKVLTIHPHGITYDKTNEGIFSYGSTFWTHNSSNIPHVPRT